MRYIRDKDKESMHQKHNQQQALYLPKLKATLTKVIHFFKLRRNCSRKLIAIQM